MRAEILAGVLALAGCADIPRDPERTEQQVRETGTLRLGVITEAPPSTVLDAVLSELNMGVAVQRLQADSESLLRDLEEGRVDLVYGSFAMDSPWSKKVHLGRALGYRAEPAKHVAAPRFAYRNGENGWIMRVETAAARRAVFRAAGAGEGLGPL